jgi:hypothetical protein
VRRLLARLEVAVIAALIAFGYVSMAWGWFA